MNATLPSRPSPARFSQARPNRTADPLGGRRLLDREPVLVVGAVTGLLDAGLAVLFAFATPFTVEQQAAVFGMSAAVATLVGALATRAQVTPTAKP